MSNDESLLDDRLSLWQRQWEQGREVSAAELCGDCPGLVAELLRRIEAIKQVDALRGAAHSTAAPLASAPLSGAPTITSPVAAPLEAKWRGLLSPPRGPDELGRLGTYRVLRVLGRGGMGVVFLAEDLALQRAVALKIMRPELADNETNRQRFLREGRAVAAVEHDHIITIFHVGETEGVPFLAMSLLQGESLKDRLKREGTLPVPEAIRIGRETAEGLAAAHQRGLIHRDIKPGNLWLESGGGRVKVLDFGLARAIEGQGTVTHTGDIVGTPAYMAPEQVRGKALDSSCDLFSLGCVLYEMMTGRPPFLRDDVYGTLHAVTSEDPPPPSDINPTLPAALSDLVMQLLSKDREKRPSGARGVADRLRGFQENALRPVTPDQSGRGEQPGAESRRRRRSRLLGALVCGSLVAAALVLTAFFIPPDGDGPAPAEQPAEPELTNSIGMRLIRIPEGKFWMGSQPWEKGIGSDQTPRHEVTISRAFYMGVHEVTVGQFERFVLDKNYKTDAERGPAEGWGYDAEKQWPERDRSFNWRNTGWAQNKDHPVVNVSWNDAKAFCGWLSAKEGKTYRLPTEAEWEYACRAGTSTPFSSGNNLIGFANVADLSVKEKIPIVNWAADFDDGYAFTAPVGQFKPNPFGLYDMHGNVWEWCEDYHGPYAGRPETDPAGPKRGKTRVYRGGSWASAPQKCCSARRDKNDDYSPQHIVGFRVVLVPRIVTP